MSDVSPDKQETVETIEEQTIEANEVSTEEPEQIKKRRFRFIFTSIVVVLYLSVYVLGYLYRYQYRLHYGQITLVFAPIFLVVFFLEFRRNKKTQQNIDLLSSQIARAKVVVEKPEEPQLKTESIDIINEDPDVPKPKRIIPKAPVYVKQLDAEKYCDDLVQYMQVGGLKVQIGTIRELFASIAASKVIVLHHENPSISERFVELFNEYIGGQFFSSSLTGVPGSFHALFASPIGLEDMIASAKEYENRIHTMSIKNVSLSNIEQFLKPILQYSWNPQVPCILQHNEQNEPLTCPLNTWFFIIPVEYKDSFTSELIAQSTVSIDVSASLVTPEEEIEENEKKVTYEFLVNYLEENYDQHYIDETEWKKLDHVEAYLLENSSFILDNRVFRQMERYTSIYLLCGGDPHEAMDNVLHTKLLPLISTAYFKRNLDRENTLFNVFEKQYGLENLRRSKIQLKDFQQTQKKPKEQPQPEPKVDIKTEAKEEPKSNKDTESKEQPNEKPKLYTKTKTTRSKKAAPKPKEVGDDADGGTT